MARLRCLIVQHSTCTTQVTSLMHCTCCPLMAPESKARHHSIPCDLILIIACRNPLYFMDCFSGLAVPMACQENRTVGPLRRQPACFRPHPPCTCGARSPQCPRWHCSWSPGSVLTAARQTRSLPESAARTICSSGPRNTLSKVTTANSGDGVHLFCCDLLQALVLVNDACTQRHDSMTACKLAVGEKKKVRFGGRKAHPHIAHR